MFGLSIGLGIGTQQAASGGGGVAAATWATTSGVNKNANLQLSNANLSFTQITYAGNANGLRASRAANPTAFEFECTLGSSPAAVYIGIDDGTPDYSVGTSVTPLSDTHTTCLRYDGAGNFLTYKNGAWTGTSVAIAGANARVTVIGDRTAGTLAFYVNGTQVGSTITAIAYANWYAMATNQDFAGTIDTTANFAGPFVTGTNAAY